MVDLALAMRLAAWNSKPRFLVKFKSTVTEEGDRAIKVMIIKDGTELFCVGFLPRHIVATQSARFVNKFAQVFELYGESSNSFKRRKNHENSGMASFALLDEIQDQE